MRQKNKKKNKERMKNVCCREIKNRKWFLFFLQLNKSCGILFPFVFKLKIYFVFISIFFLSLCSPCKISNNKKVIFSLSSRNLQHSNRAKTPTSTSTGVGSNTTWQLCYVTERILAAILPIKDTHHHQATKINDLFSYDENGNRRGDDKYESDLVHMLEQKHGKNYRLFDLESCIPTISLEKLCELCKHIETWLAGGQNKIVVLQDRLASKFIIYFHSILSFFFEKIE